MAHFAKIENNIVVDLIVIDNNDIDGGQYPDSEPLGQAFIANLASLGESRLEGTWLQTSYNTLNGLHYPNGNKEFTFDENGNVTGSNGVIEGAFRKNFGHIGYIYNPETDEFLPPEDD